MMYRAVIIGCHRSFLPESTRDINDSASDLGTGDGQFYNGELYNLPIPDLGDTNSNTSPLTDFSHPAYTMLAHLTHDSKILIIGGGTWGASTALSLTRRGYKNVTVLDPYAYPSPISAGNDVNKIVESE